MPLKYDNRIKETTTTTGDGPITLLGPVAGFRAFGNGTVDSDDTVEYLLTHGDEWEIGRGVYSSDGGDPEVRTLTRTTIVASSDSNFALILGAGTKTVSLILSADSLVSKNSRAEFAKGFFTGIIDLSPVDPGGGDPYTLGSDFDASQGNIFRITVPEGDFNIPAPSNLANGQELTLIFQSFVPDDSYVVTFSTEYKFSVVTPPPSPPISISVGHYTILKCLNLNGYLLCSYAGFGIELLLA